MDLVFRPHRYLAGRSVNVEWSGSGFDGIIARLEARVEEIKERAVEIVERSVSEGAADQAAILDAPRSFTYTGRQRVASGEGQFAGRHVTGAMIDSIDHSVEVDDTPDGFSITGRWGWPNPADYVTDQDNGTAKIAAAHSLVDSFGKTKETFKQRVQDLAKGRGSE